MHGTDPLTALSQQAGVFGPGESVAVEAFYRTFGYAILRGMLDEATVCALETECVEAQRRLVAGELDARFGTTQLIEAGAGEKAARFANYVTHITELSPAADGIVRAPGLVGILRRWLGDAVWCDQGDNFGFVYQDARPAKQSSYTRIGWHSDWQAYPHLDLCPATAVTVHIDATSPANGFLRVVPGSQRWATPAPYDNVNGVAVPEGAAAYGGYTDEPPPSPMPLGFDKVPGEIAVYADRGDILLHDGYLWHSAARATDQESRRRHVRGSWFAGAVPARITSDDFVKNAAR